MDASDQLQGAHSTASPSGELVACIAINKLRVHQIHIPQRCAEFRFRSPAKDVTSIRWSADSTRILLFSPHDIEVVELDDAAHRIRLDNGSGGLGGFISADFIGNDRLLAIWEFGRAQLWHLRTGKTVELGDLKTRCDGRSWALRPEINGSVQTLAFVTRQQAEESLSLYLPLSDEAFPPVKLLTSDAQSLCWSPDGRWLTVLDTPTAAQSLHIYTPDGHRFRSRPSPVDPESASELGLKAVTWSAGSETLALSSYYGKVILLNTRTFSPRVLIDHTTTIDQGSMPDDRQAPVWQESVSATNEHSYALAPHPVSPPLSRVKPSTEPRELGVAEASFSCSGEYLATRDGRMLSTVWIWDMSTLSARAVIVQHTNIRRMSWHPTRPDSLILDSTEGVAYLFDAASLAPPVPVAVTLPATSTFSWAPSYAGSRSAILASTKSAFCLLYPEGREQQAVNTAVHGPKSDSSIPFIEGESEDSLLEALTGRKSARQEAQASYTQVVKMETDGEATVGLDDTFRGRERLKGLGLEVDPLDDSEIF